MAQINDYILMKKIKRIKSSFLSRNYSLAKLALTTGKDLYGLSKNVSLDTITDTLSKKGALLSEELGLMKGSVMKAGQALSNYFGDALPEPVREALGRLENQSHFLDWEEIKKELPESFLKELEFTPQPLAAASIGQVHQALVKADGESLAVKIQYPGVKKAISKDIFLLKVFISSLNIIPKRLDISEVYEEIKEMMEQETDYTRELESIKKFKKLVDPLPGIKTVRAYEKYCNANVLSTYLEHGYGVRSDVVQNLSQEERNRLGRDFLELYFKELFEWGLCQTDGHFGNYMIQLDPQTKQASWLLMDFGAVKAIEGDFGNSYRSMMSAVITGNRERFFQAFSDILKPGPKTQIDQNPLWEYMEIMRAPFVENGYAWGESDIPEKAMGHLPKLAKSVKGAKSPKETLFIDRKVANVFYMLKLLRSQFDAKDLAQQYV